MHKEMWLYVGETAAWQKHIFEIQIQVHFNEQIRRSCSVETVTNWNTIHTCAITNTNTKTYQWSIKKTLFRWNSYMFMTQMQTKHLEYKHMYAHKDKCILANN